MTRDIQFISSYIKKKDAQETLKLFSDYKNEYKTNQNR